MTDSYAEMLKIMLDVDGCVADTHFEFVQQVVASERHENKYVDPVILEPDNYACFGLFRDMPTAKTAQYLELYYHSELAYDTYTKAQPEPGARLGFSQLLMGAAVTPVLITARPRKFERVTYEWTRQHGFIADLYLATDKVKKCQELGIKMAVEDKLETALELDAADIKTFLLDRGYNQGDLGGSQIERTSWRALPLRVKKHLERFGYE